MGQEASQILRRQLTDVDFTNLGKSLLSSEVSILIAEIPMRVASLFETDG